MNNDFIAVASCLSSVEEYAQEFVHQMPKAWVFDNGSNPPIHLDQVIHRSEENLLFAGGWNHAMEWTISNCNIDAIWMCNDDITEISGWMLERLRLSMELCSDAAVITPCFNSPHGTFHRHSGVDYGLREVSWIDWCAPLVNIKAWKDVGPFDDRFVGYGADIDWCTRAKQRGWKFYVHQGCAFNHIGSKTVKKLGKEEQSDAGKMDRLLREKWGKGWMELTQ